ncbi:MAG: hypothetical protein A3K19_33870 [Lentisphaerae bacterium RIFOXYB12_FULL_65_16]|nr:MAG: hypothetical protein A3K19_26575 [Lentisphaerae bacterium RIFOXYB12_FULL_65_16]OGV95235.1 MAG: hypothetical protein A3K19_33870 [Lentisphaerae bacterium RIFOXYB12_FULL_65_16]
MGNRTPTEADRPVTIRDVAARCGVSTATVSKVLNRGPSGVPISEATRAKVLAAAAQMAYVPNAAARRLRNPALDMALGLYVPWCGNGGASGTFESRLCQGILETLTGTGYELVLQPYAAGGGEGVYVALQASPHRRVRGAIIAGASAADLQFLDAQVDGPVPFVVVNRRLACGRRSVLGDMEQAARQAVQRLIARGVRTVVAVGREGGGAGDYVNDRILAGAEGGVRRAARGANASRKNRTSNVEGAPATLVKGRRNEEVEWLAPVTVPHSVEGGRAAARLLWPDRAAARHRLPLGIVCAFDLIAIGLEQELLQRGVRIPRDVRLISMENLAGVEYLPVPLTAFEQPAVDMGRSAAAALLGELRSSAALPLLSLPYRLVVRQSG